MGQSIVGALIGGGRASYPAIHTGPVPGGGGTRKTLIDEMTKVSRLPAAGSICFAFITPVKAIAAAKNELLNLCP